MSFLYRLGVGEWAESVVVFLSSCIPKAQVHWFPIHHNIGGVVVKPGENDDVQINKNHTLKHEEININSFPEKIMR